MEEDWYACFQTQRSARKRNSSRMAGAGVTHLADCGRFLIRSQTENEDLEKMPPKGTKLMWQACSAGVCGLYISAYCHLGFD